ncbi:hypothetical protein Tco_0736562 [Tanacetum coccineum]
MITSKLPSIWALSLSGMEGLDYSVSISNDSIDSYDLFVGQLDRVPSVYGPSKVLSVRESHNLRDSNSLIVDCMMVVKEIENGLLEEVEKFRWWFEQDIDDEREKVEEDEDGGEV